jgi:flagellar hook protein FlgE
LTAIQIPENATQAPQATSSFGMTPTLNSETSSTSEQIKVYDSLGNPYEMNVTFTKSGQNTWTYNVTLPDTLTANSTTASGTTTINYNFGSAGSPAVPATVDPSTNLTITGQEANGTTATIVAPTITSGESVSDYAQALNTAIGNAQISGVNVTASAAGVLTITGPNVSTTGSVIQDPVSTAASGSMTFDANCNLVTPATNVSGISFAGLSDGAAALNLTWDLYDSSGKGTISQVAGTSSQGTTTQNGYPSGTYSGFSIGSDGTVTASFSNGEKLNVGQLALGNVVNLQGLEDTGNGQYATTLASGTATIGVSGSSGLGTMEGGALEASNVNISAEFSNLIIAQRAFEANSKAVTTFDTVTQETINMIH